MASRNASATSAICRSTEADSAADSRLKRSFGSTRRSHASMFSVYSRDRNLPISK